MTTFILTMVLARTVEDAKELINILIHRANSSGLVINKDKRKVLIFNSKE